MGDGCVGALEEGVGGGGCGLERGWIGLME